ncbi:MAG: MotA/TolQ/ExbB proton channel family protein [Phycisphaerales bacterium]|jgi:biopolymer transport protein ExbB|nr:MotA/TolQ/ExbB proton channel family protein [Phycisphaerales bacterium]
MIDSFLSDTGLLLERGGYVMIPLLILSIASLALILERCWFWLMVDGRASARRLEELNGALRRGDNESVRRLVRRDGSPCGEVASTMLDHGASDAVAMEAVEMQRPRIDRFMVALSTIITAAPLLGILGTVVGIIQSFRLLGEQAALSDPTDVAGGIAAALITTAFGLIIALVTLFPYMLFRSWSSRAIGRLETLIAAAQQGLGEEGDET